MLCDISWHWRWRLFCAGLPILQQWNHGRSQGIQWPAWSWTFCPIFTDGQLPLASDGFPVSFKKNHSPVEALPPDPEENLLQAKGWISRSTCFSLSMPHSILLVPYLHTALCPQGSPVGSALPWLSSGLVTPFILWRYFIVFLHCHPLHFESCFYPKWPQHDSVIHSAYFSVAIMSQALCQAQRIW